MSSESPYTTEWVELSALQYINECETVDDDVICMVYQHRQWHEKFGEFIQSLKHLSHKTYSQKRIDLAMMNTYEKHISRIEDLMNEWSIGKYYYCCV